MLNLYKNICTVVITIQIITSFKEGQELSDIILNKVEERFYSILNERGFLGGAGDMRTEDGRLVLDITSEKQK